MPGTGEAMQSQPFAQFIEETVCGTYNAAGKRHILKGLKATLVPEEQWAAYRPDGFNEDAWNALSKEHRLYSGTIQYDYNEFPVLQNMIAGVGVLTNPEAGLEKLLSGLPPHGPRNLVTYTLEYGTRTSCDRCPYVILMSISLDADRDAERVGGNFTMLCRKPVAENVAMTGGTQQGKVFLYSDDSDPQGNYQIGGGTAFQPGTSSVATIQGYVRALGGAFANATLAGSSVAGVDGNNLLDGNATAYVSANGSAPAEDETLLNGEHTGEEAEDQTALAVGGYAGVIFDDATTANKIRLFLGDGSDSTIVVKAQTSTNSTNMADGVWTDRGSNVQINYTQLAGAWATVSLGADITAKGFRIVVVSSTTPGAVAQEFEVYDRTPGTLNFTISLPFGAGDANAPAVNNGASISVQSAYSDGIIRIPPRKPMMPQHFSVRQASTRDGLAVAAAVDKLKLARWSCDNLAETVWYAEEGVTTFTSHVDSTEPARTFGFRTARTSSVASGLLTEAKESPATPKWRELRFVHPDGDHYVKYQIHCSTSGAAGLDAAGSVRAYEFSFSSILDDLALEYDGPDSDGASIYLESCRTEA